MTTVINTTVEMLPMELRFEMMDDAISIVTNNTSEIEPEFCSLDDVAELSDEYADPFFIVSRMEQQMGAPLVFCKRNTKA